MATPPRTRREPAGQRGERDASRRRVTVIAILMMAVSVLIFLALVSYDASDEANADIHISDLVKVFTADPLVKAKADTAHNWLGLIGAIFSDFLIKSTIGYAIFCLPVLLMFAGWTMLRRADFRRLTTIINYTLIFAILVSTTFGVVRVIDEGSLGMEWSGVVGDFLANALAQLLGRIGALLLVLTGLVIATVLAVDLDVHRTLDRLKMFYLRTLDWIVRKKDALAAKRGTRQARISPFEDEPEEEQAPLPRPVKIKKLPLEEPEEQPPQAFKEVERDEEPERALRTPTARGRHSLVVDTHVPVDETVEEFKQRDPVAGSSPEEIDYVFPSVDLLDPPKPGREQVAEEELQANATRLRETLLQFDVELDDIAVVPGPVVTLYELVPATGVKISKIVSLENDIALKLAARGIRIMAPIPGKSAVGVEIPNNKPALVSIRSVINSTRYRENSAALPLAMGKTTTGEVYTDDLARMPHVLIAGSTGSGKSVGINTILASLLYKMHPSDLKLVLIDPKKIELTQFGRLLNHFLAVSPDVDEHIITNPRNAVMVLKSVEFEMTRRYDRLAAAAVKSIDKYNERVRSGQLKNTETIIHTKMPFIVVVIDELADLMMTAAGEVEAPIARLAQLARAVGIHLVVATQRPSVDVITGVIKANFPARIAYQVASKIDSRTILDANGAEQLLGNGDMLYLPAGSPKPIRLQNAYISADEVDAVMEHIGMQRGYSNPFMLPSVTEMKRNAGGAADGDRDELFDEAARLIVRHQQGSVSLLQRRLKVGYSRAARLVDELEAAGVVGPFDGSKAREVLVESEAELESKLYG